MSFILYTSSEKLGLHLVKKRVKSILALFHAVVKTISLTDYNPSGWMVSQAACSLTLSIVRAGLFFAVIIV